MAPIPSNPTSSNNLGLQVKLAATKVKKGLVLDDIPTQDDLTALIRFFASKQDDPTPFYVLDLGVVVRLMDKWTRSFPNVTPFYAVKCNNDPALLASLATLGAGFDCASKAEIEAVLSHGVSPSRIVYANPCKGHHHLKYAGGVQVNLATFDSLDEIGKIQQCHPNCSLLIRIAVPNDCQSSWRAFGTKFGTLPEEVSQLLMHAHKSGLKVVGVSFHVGSKVSEPKVYLGALAAARAVFNAAEELKMPKMHVLDIGGGFKANSLFDEIVETVNNGIKEYFSKEYSNLMVIAEPGRFFAETSFTMAANVIGKRVRGERREYWISDGIYGSFNLPAYDRSSMKVSPLLRKGDVDGDEDSKGAVVLCSSTLFGPTCDSLDTVVADLELPELEVNDFLVFHDMGAYTSSAATNFNGFYMAETPTYLAFTGAD